MCLPLDLGPQHPLRAQLGKAMRPGTARGLRTMLQLSDYFLCMLYSSWQGDGRIFLQVKLKFAKLLGREGFFSLMLN